jgi:hypothetical protein
MPKQSEGKRLLQIGLDQELVERVNDFREANIGSNEKQLIARALEFFMDHWLKRNPGVKEAYEEARKRRRSKP